MVDRVGQMEKIHVEALELFKKKNRDYGDSFATYGTVGVLVRLGDKISRTMNITNKGVTMVDTESLRDTLIDLHNYSAMALMLMDNEPIINKPIERVKNNDKYYDSEHGALTDVL